MTLLYVTEYAEMAIGPAGRVTQAPMEPPIAESVVDYTAGHAESAAFNSKTRIVRLNTDAICAVTFGTAPVAATASGGAGSARMAAGQTEYFGVPLGASFKVSAISTT